MTSTKINIIKSRNNPLPTQLNWMFDPPAKNIRSGMDKLHRHYVVLENYSDNEVNQIHTWLQDRFPDMWCSLGKTIWFDREEDRTAFLLRWL